MSEQDKEILEARKKMAEKFGDNKFGGKGTEKRKKEARHRANQVAGDKKLQALAKKSQARKINEVSEVHIFKDDNNVIQFKKPVLEYSFKEKVSFVTGAHESKNIKDILPSIIKELGPKQFQFMKEYSEQLRAKDKKSEKIEEAPELVEDFEEVSKESDKK